MELHEVWKAICENPEDDEARVDYARLIEPSDPERARFIRAQLAEAIRRRGGSPPWGLEGDDARIFASNKMRWAADLLPFAAFGRIDNIRFDRGFPVNLTVHPLVFAEYAPLLFRLAPLRAITFSAYYDDNFDLITAPDGLAAAFPIERVLAAPQLERIDVLGFEDAHLSWDPDDEEYVFHKLARTERLVRCVYLSMRNCYLSAEHNFRALASHSLGRQLVRVSCRQLETHSIREKDSKLCVGAVDDIIMEFAEAGQALEREFGYIPWLHPDHNDPFVYDARWLVDQGHMPKFPFGTPPRAEWYDIPPRPYPEHLRY